MKRKGWHRKKRRLHHDWRQQYANTLWNDFKRLREAMREHSRQFEGFIVESLSRSADEVFSALQVPGPLIVPMTRAELLEMYPPIVEDNGDQ